MLLVFCADPLRRRQPDPDYVDEVTSARAAGFDVALLDFEALVHAHDAARAVEQIPLASLPQPALYRGWMLRVSDYTRLFEALLTRDIQLLTDPAAYASCHLLPSSYPYLQGRTPQTVWYPLEADSEIPDWEVLRNVLAPFGERPILLKDYVKSRKHEWAEACFIPNAADPDSVLRVVRHFLDLQGPDLEGGLVFREFVHYRPLGAHPQSGMPLSEEYRLFWLDGRPLAVAPYWEQGSVREEFPTIKQFAQLAATIPSRFFTMDVAPQADDGEWQVIELGDGQVAGLPARQDIPTFYRSLCATLQTEKKGEPVPE